jgi:hypothetical protein
MKIKLKSVLNRRKAILFGTVCLLGGCADVRSVNWLTGEPTPEVLDAPRPITDTKDRDKTFWPNLADIPQQEPAFSGMEARRLDGEELASEKYQAQAERARIQNIPIPLPDPEPVKEEEKDDKFNKPFSALRP